MATATALLTIEEYLALPDTGMPTELVEGRIVEVPPTNFFHGQVCMEIGYLLSAAARRLGSGRVIGNDSGVITRRRPDSLRGPDVAYYSNAKLPPEAKKQGYPDQPPDLVVEVRSPSDRWPEMLQKAAEYLAAGVPVVILLDPPGRTAHVFRADQPPQHLGPDDTLRLPDLLGDFAVVVGRIFE